MSTLDLSFIDAGNEHRRRQARRKARAALSVSAAITFAWLIYVTGADHWSRVGERWVAALTMVFGSFVAGSTPQGGGAVAFPVFTKLLDIPSPVARSFSLCVQAVGMGAASASIIINRRPVVWPAVAVVTPTALLAFVAAAVFLGDGAVAFWPSILPGSYVKMTFTLVVAALAVVVFLGWRLPIRYLTPELPKDNRRVIAGLVVAALIGGVFAALVGSGADVMVYLCVVVLFGFDARIGVATSIIPMAALSVVGFVMFGLIDGQLAVSLDGGTGADRRVTAVGDTATNLPANQFDLFGLWLAAVPVVAWGAPLGAYVASKLRERHLVMFVLCLALCEVISTLIFLDELWSSPGLMTYSVAMAVLMIGGLLLLTRFRQRLFGLDPFDPTTTLRRQDLDVADDYVAKLKAEDGT